MATSPTHWKQNWIPDFLMNSSGIFNSSLTEEEENLVPSYDLNLIKAMENVEEAVNDNNDLHLCEEEEEEEMKVKEELLATVSGASLDCVWMNSFVPCEEFEALLCSNPSISISTSISNSDSESSLLPSDALISLLKTTTTTTPNSSLSTVISPSVSDSQKPKSKKQSKVEEKRATSPSINSKISKGFQNEEEKEKYEQYRAVNNHAARVSRLKRKEREKRNEELVQMLTQQNQELSSQLLDLKNQHSELLSLIQKHLPSLKSE